MKKTEIERLRAENRALRAALRADDVLDEARRILASGKRLGRAPVLRALVAEVERLRRIEAALDTKAGPLDPCVLCGCKGPVSLVSSRRGSWWLCNDAAACRARRAL